MQVQDYVFQHVPKLNFKSRKYNQLKKATEEGVKSASTIININPDMSEKRFPPENGETSKNIQQLSPESAEAEIRDAFIRWNKEVLMPILDDIIRVLEAAYAPYQKIRIIRDKKTADAKDYIAGAIKALKAQKAVYCEIVDSISASTTLSQFLTIMGLIETGVTSDEWFQVSYGMGDADIGDRYWSELWPAITFRCNEAKRIAKQTLDTSFRGPLTQLWEEYAQRANVKNLDNLGEDAEVNAKILYQYYIEVLQPLICKILAMDKKRQWGNLFKDIPRYKKDEAPHFESLLSGLSQWKTRVETYLNSLPKETTQNPDHEATKQKLFKHIDILETHLLRLQIAKSTQSVNAPD